MSTPRRGRARDALQAARAMAPALRSDAGLSVAPRVVIDRLRRAGEPSGATKPTRRLPTSPGPTTVTLRLPRRRAFPFGAPTWPGAVPRPPVESELGTDYDTGWARRYPARLARLALNEAVTAPLVRLVATPEVRGLDRIEHLSGPAIFAANHASHVDTPLLLTTIPEPWRHRLVVAGAADYFFDRRWKAATFALTLNAVPIERQRIDRASVYRLAQLLDTGWSLLIYPEGGRSPDGWGQAHQAGPAWLATRTGRPVVPVHVEGTGSILPRHANRIRPGHTTVTFGRPLRGGPNDARALADRLERSIAALADEATTDWWSATRRAATGTTPVLTGPEASSPWRRAWARPTARRRSDSERWPED